MNIAVGPEAKIVTVKRGEPVIIELPPDEHNYVSAMELASDKSFGVNTELVENIKAFQMNPLEPAFRIEFKDGRSIWIQVAKDHLRILGYSGPVPSFPEETIVPFPKNKE